jgi:hypothetical protein
MSRNKFSFNVFDNKFQDNDTYLNALKKVTDDDLYTLMIGTFLYSPLSTKAPTDNNYYLPMQQSKDSEGNLTNDGY